MAAVEPIRVLLIDVDTGWARSVEPPLQSAGLRTFLAEDLAQLSEARQACLDAVLVASVLREVDQMDLPTIVRMINRAEYLPVFWIAQDPNPTAVTTALELGIDLVLPRDVPLSVLLCYILKAARARRRIDELQSGLKDLRGGLAEQARCLDRLRDDNAQLHDLSMRDGLTKLHNNRYMHQWMAHAFAYASRYQKPLSIILIDIDHFKWINDSYGHPAGDQAIGDLARVLRNSVRDSDLVARYAGDEFLIALPETGADGVPVFAQRILDDISSIVIGPARSGRCMSCSMGSATFPTDQPAATYQELILIADQALYAAKRAGRGRLAQWHQLDRPHQEAVSARERAVSAENLSPFTLPADQ